MLVDRDKFRFAYEELKADGRACPVHVYVSTADVDSCCAFRILKTMMASDGIPFAAYPVSGYQELQNLGEKLPKDGQNRSIVLINCGGTENVRELLGLPEGTRVFVFDSHRPLDLENTRGDNRDVLVLRDEREGEETFPEPDSDYGDSSDGSDSDESDSEDDDSDSEDDDEEEDADEENESGDENAGAGRENERAGAAAAAGKEDERREGKKSSKSAKRKRREDARAARRAGRASPRTRRLRRQQKQLERVAYYSRGSFYGRAAGLLMYDIAHDTHKDALDKHFPLWLAIVSLTDQYVHQRLSHESYTAGVMELATQVSNLPNADAPTSRVLDEGVVVRAFEDRRVQYSEEFTMLRHWSLYEAMMHSSYVSTRMQLWREIGRKGLDSLFVHAGLPLDVCKQQYKHMAPQHVKRLNEKLEEHARDHGLTDLKYWSFSFSHGFKVNITASDVVFAVTSLLEGLPSATGADDDAEGDDGVGGGGGGAAFWRATRALGMSQWDEMSAGLNRAMQTQRALMRQGGLAMANKAAIRTVGGIRYFSLLDHGSPADVVFFRHPLSLLRLALYLQDALRLVKKIERPLVLSGPSPDGDKGLALVVGVTGKPTTDDVGGGNHFAHSFRRAAEHVRARFKHDSFEASVLQVAEKDLGEFMEALSDIDAERVARERMQATQ
ncbi:uncharacterized protein MICPUCDRAFT_60340 [Micromonas pusilla CCMP1545]|uniref:Predicted protein n=1 Tax=Micromonas pusilla (strain CCMP1545) TaxID=564608 RepID=C1MXZ3_MICPC|nr:uncharacterized protein MICPUCDRAFT_60340 [Micromonas pusilla CCMP1545]EEH55244.1 predicted protein [Micromonas pusilla CCMP1545]|eukprot:XP_003060475.1 predicted protein [Micromonas pusilla CCMP1545]